MENVELIAPLGREAVWLVGAEIPIPTQPAAGLEDEPLDLFSAPPPPLPELPMTDALKGDFGVRLGLVGLRLTEKMMRVRVGAVVRSVNFGSATTRKDRLEPSIETRRLDYFLDVEDGQSFAITGVFDETILRQLSRIPELASSRLLETIQKDHAQAPDRSLVLVVTPRISAAPSRN